MLVKELLSTPDKWTKGCAARDVDGVPVSPESPSAECFCLYGAIVHCYGDGPQKEIVARKVRDSIYRVYRHSCSMLDPAPYGASSCLLSLHHTRSTHYANT